MQSSWEIYDRGEESVVYYDSASGDTHLISRYAARLLQNIKTFPRSIEEIVEALGVDSDDEIGDSSEFQCRVREILHQLDDLGIVNCSL